MSLISWCGVTVPDFMNRLVTAGDGGEDTPRAARPVVGSLSCRAERRSSTQFFNTPPSTRLIGGLAMPSPSNGFDRRPRLRCGLSTMPIPSAKICLPIMSLRKLVPRATAVPFTAAARCPTSELATRGS